MRRCAAIPGNEKYMRLGYDDENFGDSVSIETQRLVLQSYAKEQGLLIAGEYNVDSVIDTIQLFAEKGQRGVSLRAEGGKF